MDVRAGDSRPRYSAPWPTLSIHWQYEGRTITFSWVAEQAVVLSRVYALAFTQDGQMLLVGERSNPDYWLHGGGIEPGERAEASRPESGASA